MRKITCKLQNCKIRGANGNPKKALFLNEVSDLPDSAERLTNTGALQHGLLRERKL